jgi:hypothetical protein
MNENSAALLNLLSECYTEAYKSREEDIAITLPMAPFTEDRHPWKLYQDFYDGRQWDRLGRFPSWKSRPVNNLCFRAVESYSTLLTDNRPSIDVLPQEMGDYNLARIIKAGVEHWWDREDMDVKVASVVKLSRIYGVGWLHLHDDSKGSKCDVVHPENILVDPDCTVENYDPTYLIHEYRVQVGDLMANYKKDAYGEVINYDQDFNPDWTVGSHKSEGNIIQKVFSQFRRGTVNPAKSCTAYRLLIRDTSKVTFDEEIDGMLVTKRKQKFPKGRVVLCAGGVVLEDKGNKYNHKQFEYVPVFAYPVPGKFYGPGDIQNIISQQISLNFMSQLIADGTKKSGGGIVLVNPNFGMTKDMVTNDVMQVHEVQDVQRAMNLTQFPSPPRHIFNYIDVLEREASDAIGLHDISNGTFTPGNKTAQEIAVIAESDKTRVRMATRWLSWSIRMLGRQLLSNMAQFDGWEYFVRVAGSYEEDTDTSVEADVSFSSATFKGFDDEALTFDIRVEEGSTLPNNQNERMQMATALFGQAVIDEEEYLKTLNWPNYKAVLARVKGAKAEMAAQQAQMQPPQQGGGGMPPTPAPAEGQMSDALQSGLPPDLPPELLAMIMERSQAEGRPPEELLNELLGEEMGATSGAVPGQL